MKRFLQFSILYLLLLLISGVVAMASWNTFIIRNSTSAPVNTPPIVQPNNEYSMPAQEFIITLGGQKAAWGTSDLDEKKLKDIAKLAVKRLDDETRYPTNNGARYAPYINIWITDGAGKFAVIANEPSNAEWNGIYNDGYDISWDILKTKTCKVYENNDKTWLPNNGVGLTFNDLANYTILAPTIVQLNAGWSGLGTGAPRELGTNQAYGINWVLGDTQSNYISGDDGYILADPIALAPPSTVWVDDDYTSSGANGGHTWGYDAFDNILDGIDAVVGSTVNVAAGTYAENIIVNKSVTILGPNANIDPCSGIRVAEAIVVPATAAISSGEIFHVAASNVTIKGFTIDGDNPLLNSGFTNTTAADIDAAEGITVYETGINNLTVENNILKNLSYFGVTLYDYPAGVPSSGHVISNNKFQDFGTYDAGSTIDYWGGGVLLYNNQYTAVTNNCMTNVRIGIQTGNFSRANSGGAAYQVISGNTIEARRRGIFHNLFYSTASPYTLLNNTITALSNVNETAVWDGILLASMQHTASFATGNSINGSAITSIPTTGISVWNCQVAPLISGGSISNVRLGINVNNYEGYPTTGSNAGNTSATIDGVAISGTTIAGVKVHDNPLNTNGSTASAEIKNVSITGAPTGILVSGPDASAIIHNNTISASAVGINAIGTVTSPTSGLNIANNQVTLTSQLAGTNPTVGIALSNISGTVAATVNYNLVSNPFYGYTVYALNTTPVTTITGGTITGIMQGVSAFNSNGVVPAPSTFGVSNITMSNFLGTHAGSFHAGVYVYTGGSNAADAITATIDKVSVTGTGKIAQDCAGLSFADFSTGAGVRQNITVTECTINNNLNRGVNIRGANADVKVLSSTLTGNGSDAFGAGGNDGYGIIVFAGAKATVLNCYITNPATSTTQVSALFTFPYGPGGGINGNMEAHYNYLSNGGNTSSLLANNSTGMIDAKYNWWGDCSGPLDNKTLPGTPNYDNPAALGGKVSSYVDYKPWLGGSAYYNPVLWLTPTMVVGNPSIGNWPGIDCSPTLNATMTGNKQPSYVNNGVRFVSDYGATKYGYSDMMEVMYNADVTVADGGDVDKWNPSNGPKNLFVTFKTGSSVDPENEANPAYYRDGRQTICEFGGPLSGYGIYIINGKLAFGMWNRFESKFLVYQPVSSSIYPLDPNKIYLAQLEYEAGSFTARLSDGTTSPSSSTITFAGISQDGSDNSGIGGATRTRYHDYSTGETYSDEFDGILGDVIVYNKVLDDNTIDKNQPVIDYLTARYIGGTMGNAKRSDDDWKVYQQYDFTGDNAVSTAYPNPFASTTSFGVNLTSDMNVTIELIDATGVSVQSIYRGQLNKGIHDFTINGENLPNGMYFYRLQGDGFSLMGKAVLNK